MQKQDYAGLSRTFDMYYPDVKQLVKESEQFYDSTYTDTERWRLTDYGNVRLIGMFTLNKSDHDLTLPRLYFKKEAEMTNPTFYVITRPSLQDIQQRIIHIGTSVDVAAPYACSVSALTGGILPHIEKSRAFSTYLKIMSCIKRYGYCTVYELQTGYDDICIKGINGTTFAKETFAKQIFSFLNPDYNYKDMYQELVYPEKQTQKASQNTRDSKIWSAVVSFKTMVNTKPEVLDALSKLSEPVIKKYKDGQQEITVTQNGNDIIFRLKSHVDFITHEERNENKYDEIDKIIPASAKILCQTGDTVYDKYTAYIAHKFKGCNESVKFPECYFSDKQEKLENFELRIINILEDKDLQVEYGNIYVGNLEHKARYISLYSDGAESKIAITTDKKPTLMDIQALTLSIKVLFGLDPETKVILTS